MKKIIYMSVIFVWILILFNCENVDPDATANDLQDESSVVTQWTEKTELFMEYPALLVGQEATFIIHFTNLKDFSAVTQGKLTSVFKKSDSKTITVVSEAPDYPGIYMPVVSFDEPGNYEMEMRLESAQVNDIVIVKDVHVFNNAEEAHYHPAQINEEIITFLKEQQWKIDFRTEHAKEYMLQNSVQAIGKILYEPLKHAEVPAPVVGILFTSFNTNLPSIGTMVNKGDVIAIISPPAQTENSLIAVRTEYLLAKTEYERAERLIQKAAIPEKRLIEAKLEYDVKKAALDAVVQQTEFSFDEVYESVDYQIKLTSPISGIIEDIHFSLGEIIGAGQKLFTVTNPDKVLLKVNVPVSRIARIQSTSNASFTVEGYDEEFEIKILNGKLISVGSSVDENSRTVPVLFSLDNPGRRLKIGMFAHVSLKIGESFEALALPKSAVFDDNGTPVAYVHLEGESFAKRILKTGTTDRGFIQILSGINPGERVVMTGGYQIKLASLSAVVPEGHGHTH